MTRPGRSVPELAALVLAAGAGRRLAPLSDLRPKPLCPVGNVALLDGALQRVTEALMASVRAGPAASSETGPVGTADLGIAVNLCNGRAQLEAHLDTSPWGQGVHRSFETIPLGTAGAVGGLRDWLDGRGLLIVNSDAWCPAPLTSLIQGWDGQRITVAVSGPGPLHARSGVVASILPWEDIVQVGPQPSGLWERFWRDRLAAGALVSVGVDAPFVDCGNPADYLRANLAAAVHGAGGEDRGGVVSLVDPSAFIGPEAVVEHSVVGAGTAIFGRIRRCVVWAGATVTAGEDLLDCVRTDAGITVRVEKQPPAPFPD